MKFAKAHGLGNDFLLVERREVAEPTAAWARRFCDRHVGAGGDGVILFTVEAAEKAVVMRLLNADGGEAEISGNGLRCLAAYVVFKGWLPPRHTVGTAAGPKSVDVQPLAGHRFRIGTDLGSPVLDSAAIPVSLGRPRSPVVDQPVPVGGGRTVDVTCTSMGNPHCAVFLDVPAADDLVTSLGPVLEHHPLFPRRTNVEFVTVVSRGELRVRFWERGVGYTTASGTGAASAAVAAIVTRRTERQVRVVCDGGVLDVEWPEGGSVRQTGEVEILFEGEWLPVGGRLAPIAP